MERITKGRTVCYGQALGMDRSRQLHMLYLHMDPETHELLYIGRSRHQNRYTDFNRRRPEHRNRAMQIMEKGYSPDQIGRVIIDGLTGYEAVFYERRLIELFKPPLNIAHLGGPLHRSRPKQEPPMPDEEHAQKVRDVARYNPQCTQGELAKFCGLTPRQVFECVRMSD